jgi:sugar/nucleoside kinase (ribokinase family)
MASDLVVAGHVCLDIAPKFNERQTFEQVFCPGRLSLVGAAGFSTGGAVANTGLAAYKLGLDTVLMGKIGQDSFGQIIREILAKTGARVAMSVSADVTSSYTVVLNLAGADRIFLHHSGANDYFFDRDVEAEEVGNSRIFHFGYPPLMASLYLNNGVELVKIMAKAKQLGVTTSLDMAMPDLSTESGMADWESIIQTVAPEVDIFLPSYEELCLMLARREYLEWRNQGRLQELSEQVDFERVREFAGKLQSFGMGIIVIKVGKNGIYLKTPDQKRLQAFNKVKPGSEWANRELWAESCQSPVFISSTGAGDCAIAGFLTALIRGFDPNQAIQLATMAGYYNLRAVDATSGLVSWPEMVDTLHNGQILYNELDLSGLGFKRVKQGLWSI